jgi:hypothetical protein
MAQWDRVDVKSVLLRNLDVGVSASIRRLFRPKEHAIVIVSGEPSSIVATNERILVAQAGHAPLVLDYHDVSGARADLPLIGARSVTLAGTGTKVATSIGFRDRGKAQRGVDELNAVIDAQNGWEDPENPIHAGFMAGAWQPGRNLRARPRGGRRFGPGGTS